MPIVPGPNAIPDAQLQSRLAPATDFPTTGTGDALYKVGSAAEQVLDKIRSAQIDTEVRGVDLKTQADLDTAQASLAQDPDWQSYGTKWAAMSKAVIDQNAQGLSSPAAVTAWTQYAQKAAAEKGIAVQTMAREKGIDQSKAQVMTLANTAGQMQEDPNVSDDIRAQAVGAATAAADKLVSLGIMKDTEAATLKDALLNKATDEQRKRTLLGTGQQQADAIWQATGGDYATAMAQVEANVKDPLQRQETERQLDIKAATDQKARQESEQKAAVGVSDFLAQGGTIAGMPDQLKAQLPPNLLLTLQGTERAELRQQKADAKSQLTDQSETNAGALKALALTNPSQFVAPGFLEGQIAKGGYTTKDAAALMVQRAQISSGQKDNQTKILQNTMTAAQKFATPMLAPYGLDIAKNPDAKQPFDAALVSLASDFVTKNGREPKPAELQEMIGQAMLAIPKGVAPTNMWGPAAPTQAIPQHNANALTNTVVPFQMIPQEDRDALVGEFRKRGVANPTTGDVMNAYSAALAGKGRKAAAQPNAAD